ncbi:MAG TPA: hypothetical protein VGX49_03110, partial [Jatrophihabitans sp.]|nr:hypothetical protein [Jatrophihabitans sp.]
VGLGVLVAVVMIAVIVLLLATRNKSSQNQAAAPSNSAAAQALTPSTQTSTDSSLPGAPSPSPSTTVPTPPEPTLPQTQSHIDLTRVSTSPQLAQVAKLLDTYFTGINNHDAEQAASVFAANGAVNPNDPHQVEAFGRGISTSTDDHIVVLSITSANFNDQPGLAVRTHFRSQQAASMGPNNETCTNWALTEKLVRVGGGYELLGSGDVLHTSC